MLHTLFLEKSMKLLTKARQALRQTSMLARSAGVQAARVCPWVPLVMHLISRMSGMASESYCELMSITLPSREEKRTSIIRHLYSSPLLKLLQRLLGVASSAFETRNKFFKPVSSLYSPVSGEATLRNTEESGIDTIASGLLSRARTQLVHSAAACPPAEEPVSTTEDASLKPYLESRQAKWDRVLTAPLKKSWESLYLMLLRLLPWWRDPSQYSIMTLVQPANLLLAGSVDRYPPLTVICSFRFLLLPRSVLLL